MTFPTVNSEIFYNEDGEVLGWDNGYGYEPDYDPYSGLYDDRDDFDPDPEDCSHDDHSWRDDFATTGTCDMCGSSLLFTAWDEDGIPDKWELQ